MPIPYNENVATSFVGLFYVVNGKMYWEGEPMNKAPSDGGLKTYRKSHYEYWVGDLHRLRPELKQFDCYYFPRGRVVFHEDRKQYELLADKCILQDEDTVSRIISAMNLPRSMLEIKSDPHYQCSQCEIAKGGRSKWTGPRTE
jgi:hypothetical protein